MTRMYRIPDEFDERSTSEERILERAFKEGCEHGYNKAMRELEYLNERSDRANYREGFEEKIERLKQKYK